MREEKARNEGAQGVEGVEGEPREGTREGMEEALGRLEPSEMLDMASVFTRENPHTAIAIAAGIGFVLGGGLTPRLLGAVGLFAARQYLRDTLRDTVDEALQGAISEQLGASPHG